MSSDKRRLFESGWWFAAALLLILLSVSIRVDAALEEICEFHLISCGKRMCYELRTSYAERSALGRFYYFESSELRVWAKDRAKPDLRTGASSVQIFKGSDGYYDPSIDRLVVRGITSSKAQEVVIELQDELETFYK